MDFLDVLTKYGLPPKHGISLNEIVNFFSLSVYTGVLKRMVCMLFYRQLNSVSAKKKTQKTKIFIFTYKYGRIFLISLVFNTLFLSAL